MKATPKRKLQKLDNYRSKGFSNAILILILYMALITKYISDAESIFMLFLIGVIICVILPEVFFFYKRRQKLFDMEEK